MKESVIIQKFFNLFWESKACQSLFLLSKEELLDTKEIPIENKTCKFSFSRIVLTNLDRNDDDFERVKKRTENQVIESNKIVESKIEKVTGSLENYFFTHFSKSFQKLEEDLEKKPGKVFRKSIGAIFHLAKNENPEKKLIKLLQEYYFIPHNITNYNELEASFKKEALKNHIKSLINDDNVSEALQFLRALKDIYNGFTYESLYNTNQIIVNRFYQSDGFQNRVRLFDLLYDAKIITPSDSEAFIECYECDSGNYKGVMQIKARPSKVERFKCPLCGTSLKYFIPYDIHKDLYSLILQKDGIILSVINDKLKSKDIFFQNNKRYLDDIEIDCEFTLEGVVYYVECKMFKINNEDSKIISKIKKAAYKVKDDVHRILTKEKLDYEEVQPLLLVNINDDEFIKKIEREMNDDLSKLKIRIENINTLQSVI